MLFRKFLGPLIFSLAAVSPCKADLVTYDFAGFPFMYFYGYIPPITGSVTVSCAGVCTGTYNSFENIKLAAGFSLDTSAGATAIFPPEMTFGIDGSVESWSLGLFTGSFSSTDLRYITTATNYSVAGISYCGAPCSTAASDQGPTGIWSVASVPGPMVGAGLPGLLMTVVGFIGWRRNRRSIGRREDWPGETESQH